MSNDPKDAVHENREQFQLLFDASSNSNSARLMSASSNLAAFDLTVASPLNQSILTEACVTAGSSAQVSEQRKHASNDVKCSELGWSCIPFAVETYGCWGAEARLHLSRPASRLAARLNCSKSHATSTLYGRLNLVLVRANARALLSPAYGIRSDITA